MRCLVAGLVSVSVRFGLFLWHDSGCPGLRLVLGVECTAHACHRVREGPHCPQGRRQLSLGAVFPGLFSAAMAVSVTVAGAVGVCVRASRSATSFWTHQSQRQVDGSVSRCGGRVVVCERLPVVVQPLEVPWGDRMCVLVMEGIFDALD